MNLINKIKNFFTSPVNIYNSMPSKVFLGGTCNGSTWRSYVINRLKIDYFNPVVENWTPSCIVKENDEKNNKCNIHLYVINSKMTGVYSIAEVIDSCYSLFLPDHVVFTVIEYGFDKEMLRSLKAVSKKVENLGGVCFDNLNETIEYLNEFKK